MSTNLQRAQRGAQLLDSYRTLSGPGLSDGECVTDLVTDIGHFCVENDLTYLHLLANGISHWRLEMTDPEADGPMPTVTIAITH